MKSFLLALSVFTLTINLEPAAVRLPSAFSLSPTLCEASPSFKKLRGDALRKAKEKEAQRYHNVTRIINALHGRGICKSLSTEELVEILFRQSLALESSTDPRSLIGLAYACLPKGLSHRNAQSIMNKAFEEYVNGSKKRLPSADYFLDTVISTLHSLATDLSTESSRAKIEAFAQKCENRGISVEKELLNGNLSKILRAFRTKDSKEVINIAISCIPEELKDSDSIEKMRTSFADCEKIASPLNLLLTILNEIIKDIPELED